VLMELSCGDSEVSSEVQEVPKVDENQALEEPREGATAWASPLQGLVLAGQQLGKLAEEASRDLLYRAEELLAEPIDRRSAPQPTGFAKLSGLPEEQSEDISIENVSDVSRSREYNLIDSLPERLPVVSFSALPTKDQLSTNDQLKAPAAMLGAGDPAPDLAEDPSGGKMNVTMQPHDSRFYSLASTSASFDDVTLEVKDRIRLQVFGDFEAGVTDKSLTTKAVKVKSTADIELHEGPDFDSPACDLPSCMPMPACFHAVSNWSNWWWCASTPISSA
ncbi:unnamed protein product, partial [Polarella glacialis]